MLTLRNARLEPTLSLREQLRESLTPLFGLSLWAVAVLCIASLGHACVSAADSLGCLGAGLF